MTMTLRRRLLAATLLLDAALLAPGLAHADALAANGATGATAIAANDADGAASVGEVVITARHRSEDVQKTPVAVSVLGGDFLAKTNTIQLSQIAQFEPSLQFTFFNARNANLNIRGLGNNVGLASDGIEPGVGFYVDGVYYDRPATAIFDLVDIGQIEVLRGPQGTLFGKNTTAGAINVTSSAPTFTPEATGEVTGGNYGAFQAKASVSGPLIDNVLAGRLSVSTTEHQGYLTNLNDGNKPTNDVRDTSVRAQLLYTPSSDLKVRIIGDYSRQVSNCCDQVIAGIVSPPNGKNFTALAQSFGFTPVVDPFNRQADTNALIQANQETGGASAQADWTLPGVILTSITSWRFWNWWPANDSDYTPISVLNVAQNGDTQNQESQEFRIASRGTHAVDYVGGLYFYHEQIRSYAETQYGNAASAFLLGATVPSVVANGYTLTSRNSFNTSSYAAYGQAVWHVAPKWNLTGGLRYTDDQKHGIFNQTASGGASLAAFPVALQNARLALGSATYFAVRSDKGDVSGQADLSYQARDNILTYVNYARGYKSGGLNLVQLPAGASPVIAPESIDAVEAGVKTQFFAKRLTVNADVFWERDTNYQANIYDPTLSKQYLANVPEVRSEGVEIDAKAQPTDNLSLYLSGTWDDAVYASYADGICGLENANLTHCNLSGRPLAGTPRWSAAAGGEYSHHVQLGPREAQAYLGLDYSFRASVYSAASDSRYTELPSLSLVNARLGIRSANGRWDAYLWARNLFGANYFTFIAPGPGNTAELTGQLGDPRTFGGTLRVHY
jgi:iron complex outermembrane receptor protein